MFCSLFLHALLPSFIPMPMGIMNSPQPIVVDEEGNVYVVNESYNVIQVYNEEGEFIMRVKQNETRFVGVVQGGCISIDYKGHIWFDSNHVFARIIDGVSYMVPMGRVKCVPEGSSYCQEGEYGEDNFRLDEDGNLIITEPNKNPKMSYSIIQRGEYLFPACVRRSPMGMPFIDRFGREWRRSLLPVPHIVVRKDGKMVRRIFGPWWLIPFNFPLPAYPIIIGMLYFLIKIRPRYCENGNKQGDDESDEANTGY